MIKDIDSAPLDAVKNYHPWKRYFARYTDLFIAGWSMMIALYLFLLYPEEPASMLLFMGVLVPAVTIIFWIPIEALFISVFGATPAKWMFGITISDEDGSNLSYLAALRRTLNLWWNGAALFIPIVNLGAHILAYKRLMNDGTTYWDSKSNSVAHCKDWGIIRTFFAVTFSLFFLNSTAQILGKSISSSFMLIDTLSMSFIGSTIIGVFAVLVLASIKIINHIRKNKTSPLNEENKLVSINKSMTSKEVDVVAGVSTNKSENAAQENEQLSGTASVKLFSFMLFSILASIFIIGIIPLLIIVASIYVTRKDKDVGAIRRSRERIKIYYYIVATIAAIVTIFFAYNNSTNTMTAGLINTSPNTYTDTYGVKYALHKNKELIKEYFHLIDSRIITPETAISVVKKSNESNAYYIELAIPNHDKIKLGHPYSYYSYCLELIRFNAFGGCRDLDFRWEKPEISIMLEALSNEKAFNQYIASIEDAHTQSTKDRLIFLFVFSGIMLILIRVVPIIILQVYDKLFYAPIAQHKHWAANIKSPLLNSKNNTQPAYTLTKEIKELHHLYTNGAIDESEFKSAKKKLLKI